MSASETPLSTLETPLESLIDDTQLESQLPDASQSQGQPPDSGQTQSELPFGQEEAPPVAPPRKKREKRDPVALVHEPGKSVLPFARVQKIIKADKEIPIVAKEATFLISLATEEFIKRLTEASQRVATRENRATVQHRDLATVVRRADEFVFLEEIIPWLAPSTAPKRPQPQKPMNEGLPSGPTMLDQFVKRSHADTQEEEEESEPDDDEDEQEPARQPPTAENMAMIQDDPVVEDASL